MQEKPPASYEELVFRITGKSFRKDGSNVMQESRERIRNILSEYDGFLYVDNDGTISTIKPEDIICDILLASGYETGYFISSKDRHIHSIPFPMKQIETRYACSPIASISEPDKIVRNTRVEINYVPDSNRINDVLEKFGVRKLHNPHIRRLSKGEFEATWRAIDCKLNKKWLMEALTENFVRKAHIMNQFHKDMSPHTLPETFDDTYVLDYAINNKGCYYDKRILRMDTISETMNVYNSAVIYRTVLGEQITEMPKDSDAVLLARRIIPYLPYRTDDQWESSNITWSMHKENLDKSEVMAAITKIGRPMFERMPGNKNTKTFDTIRMRLGLMTTTSMPHRNDFLREHKNELARIAIAKIKDSKQFQRYDIPINVLKADHMTITCQDELEIVFVLKSI